MNLPKRYDPPLKITIPYPSHIPRRRGINSSAHRGGNLRVRCSNAEYDFIQREAELCGLSLAGYCRWVIIQTARALKSHRDENLDTMEYEVKDGI